MSKLKLQAVLFDLDGVLVPTTVLHMRAWKELFDSFLPEDVPSYSDEDYFKYVDGKPRYDGVASMLLSRGIKLDRGIPSDSDDAKTICGLGNRKNTLFERLLTRQGIDPYDDTVDVLRHYIAQGSRLAVVSSSKNAREVLKRAGIIRYFDEVVDGETRERYGFRGKPAPDTFLYAAQLLNADIDATAVFEDAVSGVAAARSGNFALVVGVNRGVGKQALLAAGADLVVDNLIEVVDNNTMSIRHRLKNMEDPLSEEQYPIDDWRFIERNHLSDVSGTLFSISNGTIGVRGTGAGERCLGNGTFLSGFHENFPIVYPEDSYGLARIGQVIQGVPDACDFSLFLDGRPIDADLFASVQEIDFREGTSTITREYHFNSAQILKIVIKRVACLFAPNLLMVVVNVESRGLAGSYLEIRGHLNAHLGIRTEDSDDPRKGQESGGGIERTSRETVEVSGHKIHVSALPVTSGLAESDIVDVYRCKGSGLVMAVGLRQYVNGTRTNSTRWRFALQNDRNIEIVRYAAYHSFPLEPVGIKDGTKAETRSSQDPGKLIVKCGRTLNRYAGVKPDIVLRRQHRWLNRFWKRSDIEIRLQANEHSRLQQALRWELFQLAQMSASVPNGISAKGLSGTGYGGHYFWDTEIYIMPFLAFSNPQKASLVLDYRYRMLPAARRRAATLNLDGALFPWRTINGEEASSYFPAGTAQFHIDADIAYAVQQYISITGDTDFLEQKGIDILVETARMWASIGFTDSDGKYHIHRVTGPDEYSALVDDNFYTNVMARFNLRMAYDDMQLLAADNPQIRMRVLDRLSLEESEIHGWKDLADRMYIPYDDSLGIHPQDMDFLKREPWDFAHFRARPLLLHYHSLEIYKRQILKQPDVVMGLALLDDEFTVKQKQADFDYYDGITTGDSTLSATIQSIVAADIGKEALAERYLHESLFVDIADAHNNTSDGVHLACAGGIWMALIRGFVGMKISGGKMMLNPRLPKSWESMSFRVLVHGNVVEVTLSQEDIQATVLKKNPSFPITILCNKNSNDAC